MFKLIVMFVFVYAFVSAFVFVSWDLARFARSAPQFSWSCSSLYSYSLSSLHSGSCPGASLASLTRRPSVPGRVHVCCRVLGPLSKSVQKVVSIHARILLLHSVSHSLLHSLLHYSLHVFHSLLHSLFALSIALFH